MASAFSAMISRCGLQKMHSWELTRGPFCFSYKSSSVKALKPMSRLAGFLLALACAMPARAEERPGSPLYRLPWPEGRSFVITQAPGGKITTHFAKSSRHAIDIAMPEGTPVLAARRGVVIASEARHVAQGEPLTDLGNFVRVRHEDGTLAVYAHLAHEGVAIELDEEVEAGRLLGYSGTTGYSTGPHLHFGVSR